MKTRIGKIARLPKKIREQLNQRLENGESGNLLVKWLNQLPEVQKILTKHFVGQAIRPQNLSEWRKGGYIDWLRHQQLREHVRWNTERSLDLNEDEEDNDTSDNLACYVAAHLVVHARILEEIKDPKERWVQLRQIARELSRLRRDDHRYRRLELRRLQLETNLERMKQEFGYAPETDEVKTPKISEAAERNLEHPTSNAENRTVTKETGVNSRPSHEQPPPPPLPIQQSRNPPIQSQHSPIPELAATAPVHEGAASFPDRMPPPNYPT